MSRCVLMLTRDDRTIPDAREHLLDLVDAGVRHAGCSDLGLRPTEMEALFEDLRAAGMTTYLEIVSEGPAATLAATHAALRVGPDYVVGGTGREETARLLAGNGIGHLPYLGRVVGHPRWLRGTVEEIAADAAAATAQPGVDGITLLAYRYDGGVERLVEAVMGATSAPVLCAGSVDSPARIALLRRLGVWGFTIGAAIVDGTFQRGRSFIEQLQAAVELAGDDEAPSGV